MSDVLADLHIVLSRNRIRVSTYSRNSACAMRRPTGGRTDIGKRDDIDSIRGARFGVVLVHQGVNWNLRIHTFRSTEPQLRLKLVELLAKPSVSAVKMHYFPPKG